MIFVNGKSPFTPEIKTICFTIDAGATLITAGLKGYIIIPKGFTLTGWNISSPDVGSTEIDIWKCDYNSAPPVIGDSITNMNYITLISNKFNKDDTIIGWEKIINNNDVVAFNIISINNLYKLTVVLKGTT
jgi:hypothetical protein